MSAAFLFMGCAPALHDASRKGQDARVSELLGRGARIDEPSRQGLTALMWAAFYGRLSTTKLLLEKGASVNALDESRRSAIWYAATEGHSDIVKLLVAHGADLGLLDMSGKTVVQGALDAGHPDIAQYLSDASKAASQQQIQRIVAEEAGPDKAAPKKLIASDVDEPHYHFPPRPDDFAIIVGVEKYKALPSADYAVRDAEAVRRHVQALGVPADNIIYLAGTNATRAAMASYIEEWLPRNVKPDSSVLVYFSGHGAPDPEKRESYLMPWDGDPAFLQSSAYPTKRLYTQLARLKVKRSLVLLDACFSGLGGRSVLPKGARPLVGRVDASLDHDDNVVLLRASGSNQIAGSLDDEGHGLFTYFLLKGLGGEAKDSAGNVTADSLYWYLKPLVEERAHRENREQSPSLEGPAQDDVLARWR